MQIKLLEAADRMQAFYATSNRPNVVESLDVDGVQAYMLKDGCLIIPGTNELSDWFEYNLNVYNIFGGADHYGFDVAQGDSKRSYHAGFLDHARAVYGFAKPQHPKFIIGHSLGAASAQIVGSSLGVPTIAFASPRVLRGKSRLPNEGYIINLCRSDDTVTQVPPAILGFRHIGKTFWMNPEGIDFWEDHRIDEYIQIMAEPRFQGILPESWPLS